MSDDAPRQRRRFMIIIIGTFAAVIVVIAALMVGSGTQTDDATTPTGPEQVSGVGAERPPPWPLPANTIERVERAGLSLGPMGTAEHYHAHLDIIINGQAVAIPSNIGVDDSTGEMAALHTHTPDGVIHIEAASNGDSFTLGQLFTEWNVRLATNQIGSVRAGARDAHTVYIDGEPYDGNPATLKITDEQQIAIVYGNQIRPSDIPATFDFAQV